MKDVKTSLDELLLFVQVYIQPCEHPVSVTREPIKYFPRCRCAASSKIMKGSIYRIGLDHV